MSQVGTNSYRDYCWIYFHCSLGPIRSAYHAKLEAGSTFPPLQMFCTLVFVDVVALMAPPTSKKSMLRSTYRR